MKIRELRELKRHLEKIRQLEIEEKTEDSEFGVEVVTLKRYYIGKVYNGNESGEPVYRAVIGDNKQLLADLGAVKIREIQNAEDISEYWKEERLKGYVELYLKERAPEWIYEGLEQAEWEELVSSPLYRSSVPEKRKPTEVKVKKYFEIDEFYGYEAYKVFILEDEVRKDPERFLETGNPELREFAEECLEEIRKRKQEEWKIYLQRQKGNDLGPDM